MSRRSAHHYVPQWYLERFCDSDGKITVYDKWESRTFQTVPRNVAQEVGFYRLPPPPKNAVGRQGLDVEAIEKHATSRMDSLIKSFLDDILTIIVCRVAMAEGRLPIEILEDDGKTGLAYPLVFQLLRTREAREFVKEVYRTTMQALLGNCCDQFSEDQPKLSEEDAALAQMKIIFASAEIGELVHKLERRHWSFRVVEDQLLTSDHPITRWSPLADQSTGMPGMGETQTRLHYPLDPKIAVVISTVKDDAAEIKDGYAVLAPQSDVRHMNELQVLDSYRYVYARDRSALVLAEAMCTANPELRKPKKQRVVLV
jgi:hypothetical protein